METLNSKDFKRNLSVKSKISSKGFTALEDLYIYFPVIYESKELAIIDDTSFVFGVLAVADKNNNYVVMTVPTMVSITPESITEVSIDEVLYYKATIPKGTNVFDSNQVVVQLDMAYLTFDVFFRKGKVPFFVSDIDLLKIFNNLGKYADTNITAFLPVVKLLIGIICRSADNLKIPYRLTVKTKADLATKKMEWISINNTFYAYSSTMSKIGASYMRQGMTDMLGKKAGEVPPRTGLEALIMK